MIQHPVDQAESPGFLCGHEIVTLAGGGDFFDGPAGVLGENAVHPRLDGFQTLQVDSHIRDLTLGTRGGLVDHDLGIGQRHTLALGAGAQQERAHRSRQTDADGRDIALNVLHNQPTIEATTAAIEKALGLE